MQPCKQWKGGFCREAPKGSLPVTATNSDRSDMSMRTGPGALEPVRGMCRGVGEQPIKPFLRQAKGKCREIKGKEAN